MPAQNLGGATAQDLDGRQKAALFLLAIGSTVGATLGTKLGRRLRADQLKILLALIVLCVAVKVGTDLFLPPRVLLSHLAGAGAH